MLFYFEEKWAYMLGIFAPAAWLIITFVSGGTISALRQLRLLITGHGPEDAAAFISLMACILSVLMIIVCAYRWKQEYAGLGKGMKTALVSLLVTVVYYGIMIVWFWHSFPHSSATG
jgi:hydrogenase-4 membrane subunit HyfE